MRLSYSAVVPIYNEEDNVAQLHKELSKVMNSLSGKHEIIYVDDGSSDNTLAELKKLKGAKIISLNRNYGQSIAIDAGFKAAEGEIVISLDGDLQNDPADIPKLIQKLKDDNLDVVAGWRRNRKDSSGIKILTRTGRLFRRLLIKDGVHDTGCTLRVYRKEAVKSLDLWGEMHRYILALLKWKGFRIGEIEVNHRPRTAGKTKYNYTKAGKGFVDLIYIWFINKYSNRPLHIFGLAGVFLTFIGILAELWAIYGRIAFHLSLNRNGWFYLGFFSILAGVIFFSFGILLDIVIRTYLSTSPYERRYYVRETIKK